MAAGKRFSVSIDEQTTGDDRRLRPDLVVRLPEKLRGETTALM